MTIYNSEGVAIYEAPITKSAVIKRELMGDYYIELSFDAVDPIGVGRGSYILHEGRKFEIMDNSLPEDTNTGGLRYTLRFEAQQSQMKRCKVFWRESDNLEVSFSDTTSISQFGNLIVKNINAFLGGDNWSLGSCPEDNTLKTISFGGDTCWDAVNTIAETFGVEWWTEENGDKVSLCFGKLEIGTEVEFKKGDVVSSIPYRKGDSANYGTRFYVFGSTRNLPEDYASTESGGITNHVVEKRLHLPNGQQYIDAKPNLKAEDIVEQVVFFDDIYPTNVDTITSLSYNSDGKEQLVYTVRCENTPFTPSNIIDGEQIQATFTSGSLNGRTFDIEIDRNNFDKRFEIIPEVLDEENGLFIPNASLKPNIDDTFILTGIVLPDGRVKEAEQLLLEAGTEYARKNSNDTEVYDCPTNAIYCHANDCNYNLGQRVKLIGEKFGSGRSSRIQGYEKLLYDEYQAVYTVGDNSAYSRLGSVEKAVQKSEYSDRVGLEANIIRSKSDNTTPSDYNIYSALATEGLFLSKRKGGIVKGMTDFAAGLKVGGKAIRYDAEKKAWFFDGDFVVTGAITMFGNSEGFKPSTIMDAVQVDGRTIVKNAAGQLVAIGGGGSSSGGGGLIVDDVNALINAALVPYALKESIPTNNTQLDNGAGYITGSALNGYATEQWVSNQGYAKQSALDGVDNRLKSVETFFATSDTDNLVNKWDEIVAFLNATEGDTLDNILKTKANQSALDDAVASLTTEIGKKWTQNDAKIANWDSAYGWGNHANAGYAAKTYVDGELAKYVKLATAQTISARHNFSDGLQIGGITIRKSQDGVVYIDGNLVISGALTMFGTGSTTFPTIWSQIPFNTTQMKWENGVWNIIGGGSGSVNEATVNNLIYEYLTKNSYAKISDIGSALMGYATQTWVEGKKYLTGITSSQVTTALGFTPYNATNPNNYISGITSKMVTDALGFTPYNATNPDKYIKGIDYDMVIAAIGYTPYSTTNPMGYLTISSLLGYATEQWVGDKYLAKSGGTIEGVLELNSTNAARSIRFNTTSGSSWLFVNSGEWYVTNIGWAAEYKLVHSGNIGSYNAGSATKLQTARTIWGQSFDGTADISGTIKNVDVIRNANSNWLVGEDAIDGNVYIGSSAFAKARILDNINGQLALTAVGGVLAKLPLLRSDPSLGALDSAGVFQLTHDYGFGMYSWVRNTGDGYIQVGTDSRYGSANAYNLFLNPLGGNVAIGGTTADAKLHVHGDAIVGGNANNYLKIETDSQKWWIGVGVEDSDDKFVIHNHSNNLHPFIIDTYGNVGINIRTTDTLSQELSVAGGIDIYELNSQYTGVIGLNRKSAVGGLYNPSYAGWQIHNRAGWFEIFVEPTSGSTKTALSIGSNGNTTINGDLLTTGAITMFSQLSMKNVIDYDGLSLAQLAQIKPARFTWKDGRDNRIHVGGIADEVMQVLPEVIHRTSDDKLTMDYGSAAFYIGASLIKPVVELWEAKDNHEKRIAELERENKRKDEVIAILQNKLNQLRA